MLLERTHVRQRGGEVELTTQARQSNLPTLALAEFLRRLPEQERCFFKNCKVVGFMPIYMPAGMFAGDNMHVHKMDRDQLDYAMRAMPEFRATDDAPQALPQYFDLAGRGGGDPGGGAAPAAAPAHAGVA